MPAANNQKVQSKTITKKISFADYSPHPVNVNQFFLSIPVTVPPNFNGMETIIITNSFVGLFAQNVGFYYDMPNGDQVTLTDVVAGLPSIFFGGIPVPSAEKITLGISATGMLNNNGSTTDNPDAVILYPYFGFAFNARSFAIPITHPINIKFFVFNLVPVFTIDMDVLITYFRE